MHILNEVSVMLCSFVLISTLMLEDIDLKYNVGFLYIIFNSSLLIINLYKLGNGLAFKSIPQLKREHQVTNKVKHKENRMQKWLNQKKANADKNAVSKEISEHAENIV